MLTSKTVQQFLDETASNSPAPGGGSVSAFAAALGAALTSMVCRLTIEKKKYADVQKEMEEIIKKSEALRAQFTSVIDEDTLAFNNVMQAFGMPKETDEQKSKRNATIQDATKSATLVPLRLMELCEQAVALTKTVAEKGSQNSISDTGVAALLLQAAAKGAHLNVRINLGSIEDQAFGTKTSEASSRIADTIDRIATEALASVVAKV